MTPAAAHGQKLGGVFRDPEDGRMDVSEWLLTRKGFLPIPIIVTEPAVGYGGGVALAFFSQSLAEGAGAGGTSNQFSPPLIATAAGFYTSDGSYGGGIALFYPFRHDQFRYLGALGGASLNLDFYGGAGRVAETLGDLGGEPTVGAGGVGFRYLIARKLGLGTGVDFALGPGGDFAFYIQTGSAWR